MSTMYLEMSEYMSFWQLEISVLDFRILCQINIVTYRLRFMGINWFMTNHCNDTLKGDYIVEERKEKEKKKKR